MINSTYSDLSKLLQSRYGHEDPLAFSGISQVEIEYLNYFLETPVSPDLASWLSCVNSLQLQNYSLLGMRRIGDLSTIVQCYYSAWDGRYMIPVCRSNGDEYACLWKYDVDASSCVVYVEGSSYSDPTCILAEDLHAFLKLQCEVDRRDDAWLADESLLTECSPKLSSVAKQAGINLP